ncbi:MAG: hypothetical protein ACI8VC_002834 [Candidatus Endobugula sp.]|jgi:hypothetical protein
MFFVLSHSGDNQNPLSLSFTWILDQARYDEGDLFRDSLSVKC